MIRFFYLIVLLILAFSTQAQGLLNNRVSLNESNKSIAHILEMLETDDLRFTYSSDLFDVQKRVSIRRQNATIEVVLKELFAGQNVEFLTMGNQVIIKRKTVTTKDEQTEEVIDKKRQSQADVITSKNPNRVADNPKPVQNEVSKSSEVGGNSSNHDNLISGLGESEKTETALLFGVAELSKPELHTGFEVPQYSYRYGTRPQQLFTYSTAASASNDKSDKSKSKISDTDPAPRKGPRFSGSVYTAMTSLNEDLGVYIGARGLYYLTPNFGIGFGGGGYISPIIRDEVLSGDYRITGGYGGLLVEYSFRPMKLVHMNYHALFAGGGSVYYREPDLIIVNPNEATTPMFVFEPGVTLEVNVLSFFRMGFDATYRFTSSGTLNYQSTGDIIYTTESLRGLNIGISLKFGRF